ncbi:DUF3035 domain-containing protein [Roseovarius indicus]|uniref:DUF3035 domain-containing protein n=1 Tax=Roseovarius indicus TaxID=540747 RepID=UPI0032EEE692
MMLPRKIMMIGLVLVVAACSRDRDVTLTRFKNTGDGPDEFSIAPGKPLEAPESYAALPTPQPGAANRTDQNPKADGIAALGGNPAATADSGVAPGDAGLVRHAARYGTDPTIRQRLRVEDKEIRRNYGRRNIFRIGPRDNYTDAYKRQWLDSDAEQRRMRNAGVITPTAPPPSSR